jgi:hypothetical protein
VSYDGTSRPLSAQALDALIEGDAHPDGHVFAPLGTSQALLRRDLVRGERGRTMVATFGDNVRTTITPAGRSRAAAERLRRLDAELNPPSPAIEPSWDVFEPCRRLGCDAETGQCCIDVRRGCRRAVGEAHPLRNPHRGRRQLGPRADSIAVRTGAAR